MLIPVSPKAPEPHYWEVFAKNSGRVLGKYSRGEYQIAIRDAGILANSGTSADVRRAI